MTVIIESNILELTTITTRCNKHKSKTKAAAVDTIEAVVIEENITLEIPTASPSELLEWLKRLQPDLPVPPHQKARQTGAVVEEVSSDVQP